MSDPDKAAEQAFIQRLNTSQKLSLDPKIKEIIRKSLQNGNVTKVDAQKLPDFMLKILLELLGQIKKPVKPPAPAAPSFSTPRLAVQAIGQLPEIPSIQVRNKTTGVVQDCKAWFRNRMSNADFLPAKDTMARTYLDADGDVKVQEARKNEIIQYICDHDASARQIIENVGRTIRALLKKTLMIPQLLAENARLCAMTPRQDLVEDQRLLMEQLAYMAMQMKRLTESLNFSYDPATQKFYRLDDQGEITETLDNENLKPIFGLDTAEVKELWDVLSSSQTGSLYGQKLNIYPRHQNCQGETVTTPMFNIILTYADVTNSEFLAAAKEDTIKDAVARAYLLRLWELTAPTSEPPSASKYKMPYNKAFKEQIYEPLVEKLRPYITVLVEPETNVQIHIRVPFDFFEASAPDMGTTLSAVLGAGVGGDIKQLALTSLAIRPPKVGPDANGPDAWLAEVAAQNKKMDINFMTYDELDPEKFNPPGVAVKK